MRNSQQISILMPVYNTANYLKECLDSIIRQTDENWELIAVDDFSTDQSYQILQEYATKDSRIKVLKNNQKGIIGALRVAFQYSSGQYITRMDSDDRMMPKKLEVLKDLLLKNGRGYVATGLVMYFADDELKNGYKQYEAWLNDLTRSGTNFNAIYKECVIPSPCWMTHRADLISCGAFDHDDYPEDYDLCFRFYKNKLKVVGSSLTLHLWRDYPNRTSRTDERYSNQQYFDLKLKYFLDLDYDDSRPLIIWGAGRKGKELAKKLHQQKLPFYWLCNNRKKWGVEIYETKLQNFELLPHLWKPQVIVAVAAPDGKQEILQFMHENELRPGENYHFFC